jgi:UTP--glucose-1-phosphate uridylyltransferase
LVSIAAITQKAVIPAAGLGSRLDPISRVVPKEMFPIGSFPCVEWVIMEAIASGCTDIAVIINPRKRVIEKYLTECCPTIAMTSTSLRFLNQPEPLGLGHALLTARDFCEGAPVAVLLPDELWTAPKLPLAQLSTAFRSHGGATFALVHDSVSKPSASGHWFLDEVSKGVYAAKPLSARGNMTSRDYCLTGTGRYLISPEFLDHGEFFAGQLRNGEIDDALLFGHMLEKGGSVHGVVTEGLRFDVSTSHGYIGAWQYFAGKQPFEEYPCTRP